jgi:inhibitor of KinA sporulation pathway (predicted exonuclease)
MSFRPRNAVPFATQAGGASKFVFQAPKPKEKVAAQQKYDYFLVMDFEATCLDNVKISPQEIIEFPCLKLNSKTLAVESQFHSYVRPVIHPRLDLFCTGLTGITQDMVDSEKTFEGVFEDFQKWLQEENLLQDTR